MKKGHEIWEQQQCAVVSEPIVNLWYIADIKLKESEDTITVKAYLMSKLYSYLDKIDASIIEEVVIKRVDRQVL